VFGEVVDGREVVDKIAQVPVGGAQGDTPTQSVWIEKLTVKES
jgi:cyclophilin family peptidyl-prolyl cis-trans isomerase